jgi:predicted dienelactone hydrolase
MEQRRLWFTSSGRSLQGTLRLPGATAPAPCAVLCHGFGSYEDDLGGFVRLAESLAQAGLASFRFGFPGSHPYADKGTIRPASPSSAVIVVSLDLPSEISESLHCMSMTCSLDGR